MDSNTTKQIIIGVIALVIGLIGGFFWGRGNASGPAAPQTTATSTVSQTASTTSTTTASSSVSKASGSQHPSNPTVVAQDNSVSVANQPAGDSVAVGSVTLTQEGWVAIRDAQGRTLGAALFPAGTHANVSVPLLRATVAGQRYQALVYFDNGNKQFDLNADTLVENADGSIAGTTFDAQ